MSADKIKSTFFNVIMKSSEQDNTNLGLHLTAGLGKNPTVIASVDKGSVSEACGLRPGDVVDMVNGKKVTSLSAQEVEAIISRNKERVHLQIRRNNSKKLKHSFKESNEEVSSSSTFSKAASTEGHMRRKKSREGSCGSFMHRLFRSRSQDQCKGTKTNHYGSTARSSSLIVHLSSNVLSSSQNTLNKTNRLSSCMKLFKSKKANAEQEPEIDVSVVSPNNAYTRTLSKETVSLQEASDSSTSATSATVPISLNVVNSQVSPTPPSSSSKTIVNISPTLEILNICSPNENVPSKPVDPGILNYIGIESTTGDKKSTQRVQTVESLKYYLPPLHSRVNNAASINSSVNTNSSNTNEITTGRKENSVQMATSNSSSHTLSQKKDHINCWNTNSATATSQTGIFTVNNLADIYSQKTNEELKSESEDILTITEESLKTSERFENEKVEKEFKIENCSQPFTETTHADSQITQTISTRSVAGHDNKEPLVPPKRSMKFVLSPQNELHITKTKTTPVINSTSNLDATHSDSGITTTAPLEPTNLSELDIEALKCMQSAEEREKMALDKTLEDALFELKVDTSLCNPRPDASNQHSAITIEQNNVETSCEGRNYDLHKHDFQKVIYGSNPTSAGDNNSKSTYTSKAEVVQKDYNKEIAHQNFITNDSLVLYSINNDDSDVGHNAKSPDSGISSISSPPHLNERLEKTNLVGYKFNEPKAQTDNFLSNVNFSYEDNSVKYENSASEQSKRDKKLINVVSPTKEDTQTAKHKILHLLKRPSEDLVGTFHDFKTFNNEIVRSEIEVNPHYRLEQSSGENELTEQQRIAVQNTPQNFTDEFGNPIIRPPSYNSVVYCGALQDQTQPASNSNSSHHEHNKNKAETTISSNNNQFQKTNFPNNQRSDLNYDTFQTREPKHQKPEVSRGQDGIYEQIPARGSHHFVNTMDNFCATSREADYSNQTLNNDFSSKQQTNSSNFQAFEQHSDNSDQMRDFHNQQFNLNHQGYYFSDETEKGPNKNDFLKSQFKDEEMPIELQREGILDELKQAFIDNKRASEGFYATSGPQSFTPINKNLSSQWSESEFSTRNHGIDPSVDRGYGDNMVFGDDMENDHRIDNMEEVERQRMYIKELHQARNRNLNSSATDGFMGRHETLYENLEQPSRTRITKYRGKARVLHNFRARKPVELSLRKGEVVFLLRKIDKNWVEGEHHNMTGIFPLSYVQVIESIEDAHATARLKEGSATVLYDFHSRSPLELPLRKGYIVTLVRKIDDNWYEGRFGKQRGIFPSSYVLPMREPDTPLPTPCASPLNTPGWRSPSAASMFSMDYPSVCPSEFNADLSRVSTPMGGSILEGYMPGFQSLPRPSSVMPIPGYGRNFQGHQTHNAPLNYNWRVRNNGNFDYNSNYDSTSNYRHTTNSLKQPLYNQMLIEEEIDRLAPQKPFLQGGTLVRMTTLQPNHRHAGTSHYDYQLQDRNKASTYSRNINVETMDRRNNTLNYPKSFGADARFNRNLQDNQAAQVTRLRNNTIHKQGQKEVLSQKAEREIVTSVKPIIYPRYKVLHNFEARNPEEITLRRDEILRVVERCRDGWFIGFEEKSRDFGLFPGNYVELIKSS